jgi:biopolymer transport protein ExbD
MLLAVLCLLQNITFIFLILIYFFFIFLPVGYNPINGEAYAPKDNVNSKTNENDKQPDLTVKAPEEQNVNAQAAPTDSAENNNAQVAPATTTENGNVQAAPAKTSENGNAQKLDNAANGNNAQKVRKN